MTNKISILRFCLLVIALTLSSLIHAQVIRVTGSVLDEKKNVIQGVNITDDTGKRTIAVSDMDGKFAVNVMGDDMIIFSYVGYKKEYVKIKGRTNITITLKPEAISLKGVEVVAKRVVKKVVAEPTSIEVKGQYFYVRTRIRVPKQIFNSNCRLVVQPVLHDLTLKRDVNMKPLVFDGKEYNTTQGRMYDFDFAQDSLAPYVIVKGNSTKSHEKRTHGDILPYTDSLFVKNIKHDFSCDVFMAIENYRHIVYGDTTTIAKGTVNPLRFLQYKFLPKAISDSTYFPKVELQLRDSKGDIKFIFPIGKSKMDTEEPTNRSELSRLEEQLKAVENGNGTKLRDFNIKGYASPDGLYKRNLLLAQERMKFASDLIVSRLSASTRDQLKVGSDAEVASWNDLIKLMRKDSLNNQADLIQKCLDLYAKKEVKLNNAIRHLDFFHLLESKYLPMLRKSEYSFMYTIYRQLTIEEIQELYNKDYTQLSKYEFWKLYSSKTDVEEKAKICRQALQVYPTFMMAANDLAIYKINKGEPDDSLLTKYAGADAPKEVNMNHIIALLEGGQYAKADTISQFLSITPETKLICAVARALDGKYEETYMTIAETGKRNEVLMLLAMKRNNEALMQLSQLPDSEGLTHYLKAICLNRMDKPTEAYEELKEALEKDPSLKATAKVDADVNNLLPKDEKLNN